MAERDQGADRGAGVLARWSRRKRAQRERAQRERDGAASLDDPRADEAPAIERAPTGPEPGVEASGAEGAVRVEDLPDIESLTYESDFTVFLAKGVPKALRSRALKKLWRSDPILANLDGLNDHDLDYRHVDIRTLAARSVEDLARGTKRLTASDRAAERPERSTHASDRPAAAPGRDATAATVRSAAPPASDPPATTVATAASPKSNPPATAGIASSAPDPPATAGGAASSAPDSDAV